MRVLVMATPSPTHFTPMVPMLWALRAAGHDVLVVCQPDDLAAVASAGLNATCIGEAFDGEGFLLRGLEGKRPLQARPRESFKVWGYGRVWAGQSERVVDAYLAFTRDHRPDLILSDPLDYAALIVGGVLGVPVVQHRWGVDPFSADARKEARIALQHVCDRLGIAELPEPAELFDPCPPSLQLPDAAPGTPIRAVPFNGNGQLPLWLRQSATAPRGVRRVAFTLGGTLPLNGVPLARDVLTALGAISDVEVIATVDERFRAELGEVPDSVRLVDPLPLHLLFGSCDAAVHHGGSGTTMTATGFGLPQLVLPQLADHFAHGDRLAELGAGITFDTARSQEQGDRLREALVELLEVPGYAKAAAALSREMADMPAPSRVVADLERGWADRAH
ncbi:nucleotide disphospho-sugar-binding domain-containing protein [Streptomyces sp. NPDC001315]|uniref:nucleotide disphospho-sugar-binding domain-containing protein n=1 Tax=Streptomyces sp. NPDC001315 TaxID=3364562 RepID=UPI003681DE4F